MHFIITLSTPFHDALYRCVVVRHVVVVVCLPRPMEGMGWLQFSDLFTELPVPPQADRVVGTFYCAFYITFWALRSHFWTLRMPYYFYKVSSLSFFLCTFHFLSQIHFTCVLCNKRHWRILLMTEATGLDQLVYSPNCYIKIFTHFLPAVRLEPPTTRS